MTNPNFVVLALLDVSKAFDRLDRHLVIDKIYKLGVTGRLFKFLVSYFHDRKQCVRIGNTQSDFVVGSVIILFVFLLYINDICDCIHESEFALFMDDVALMISDTNSDKLVSRLNADLNRIFGWLVFNRMVFDSEKFHLLGIGIKKLSSAKKSSVFF